MILSRMFRTDETLRKTGARIVVAADTVYRLPQYDAEAEAQRLNRIHACGQQHGFVAPCATVVTSGPYTGFIEMPRLVLGEPLSGCYRRLARHQSKASLEPASLQQLMSELGRVLNCIHHEMAGDDYVFPYSVGVHADFGFSNVYYGSSGSLTVIDPFPWDETVETSLSDIGHAADDLAMMTSCLIGRLDPISALMLDPRMIAIATESFWRGYSAPFDMPSDFVAIVLDEARETFDRYIRQKPGLLMPAAASFLWTRRYRGLVRYAEISRGEK